ncbi:hypothetical protein [Herbiconiux solani]|uniref:hypothetical protein n=1 Tax=Herbiconiux solani TaxID=661329 RepID=UPI0008270BBD|nr:hypothetical protein [Herbiconiux solani]
MTGFVASGGVRARPVGRAPHLMVWPHAVMAGGMLVLLLAAAGSRSGVSLAVAAACILTSLLIAPRARTAAWAREAILDLWAMALLTLPMAGATAAAEPAAGGAGAMWGHHATGSALTPWGLATDPAVVLVVWFVVRAAVIALRRARGGSLVPGTLVFGLTAVQLGLMLLLH